MIELCLDVNDVIHTNEMHNVLIVACKYTFGIFG